MSALENIPFIRLNDTLQIYNGCLAVNGRPVVVESPLTERIVEIDRSDPEAPLLIYLNDAGASEEILVTDVTYTLA